MKRWHDDYFVTLRQWKLHHRDHVQINKDWRREVGRDPYDIDCPCDNQIGRFRKRDAYDCGNPGCFVCHSDKFPKRDLTEQELNSDLGFKEQVKEFWEDKRKK